MNINFDRYLDPPEDDSPVCEDCGQEKVQDLDGTWYCANTRYCPGLVPADAKYLAEELIEANETIEYLRKQVYSLTNQLAHVLKSLPE